MFKYFGSFVEGQYVKKLNIGGPYSPKTNFILAVNGLITVNVSIRYLARLNNTDRRTCELERALI